MTHLAGERKESRRWGQDGREKRRWKEHQGERSSEQQPCLQRSCAEVAALGALAEERRHSQGVGG